MKKQIYKGFDNGIYNEGPFEKFMRTLEGANWVIGRTNTLTESIFMVFHIEPQHVTLKYKKDNDSGIASDTSIHCYGEKEEIGKIEKIIEAAAKDYITSKPRLLRF